MSFSSTRINSPSQKENAASNTDVVSVRVAATRLDCHKNTVYHLIEAGELEAFRLTPGGRWKIRASAIEEFIQSRQAKQEMRRLSLGAET